MKKQFLFLCILAGFLSFAQEDNSGEAAAPATEGSHQFDVSAGVGVGVYGVKGRMYDILPMGLALRLGVDGSFDLNTYSLGYTKTGGNPSNLTDGFRSSYAYEVVLTPGAEKHWQVDQFNTYLGAMIIFSFMDSYDEMVSPNGNYTAVDGGWMNGNGQIPANLTNRRGWGIGAGAVAGGEYHFSSRFFLGCEVGYGVVRHEFMPVETLTKTYNGNNVTTTITSTPDAISVQGRLIANVRVGFKFF